MKLKIVTLENKAAGEVELKKEVFGLEPRADILQRMVRYQLARRQAGTHKTQERSEVTATTAKMFRQKGTGNARHGSKSATQFVGGGTVFGPRVRSHAHKLTKKFRALAMKHALSSKATSKEIIVLENVDVKDVKTKSVLAKLAKLGVTKPLFVVGEKSETFAKAVRNLKGVDVLPIAGANVYDILNHKELVLTQDALKALEERLA